MYVRKMTLIETVYSAIETTLANATARYRYTEIFPRTFLIRQGHKVGIEKMSLAVVHPIGRFMLAMSTNAGFVGAKATNPFHHQQSIAQHNSLS